MDKIYLQGHEILTSENATSKVNYQYVTQAFYDMLVAEGNIQENTLYIITDAE